MEKQGRDLRLARKLVSLAVRMKRIERRCEEQEERLRELKENMGLRLKLLEDEVRKW